MENGEHEKNNRTRTTELFLLLALPLLRCAVCQHSRRGASRNDRCATTHAIAQLPQATSLATASAQYCYQWRCAFSLFCTPMFIDSSAVSHTDFLLASSRIHAMNESNTADARARNARGRARTHTHRSCVERGRVCSVCSKHHQHRNHRLLLTHLLLRRLDFVRERAHCASSSFYRSAVGFSRIE